MFPLFVTLALGCLAGHLAIMVAALNRMHSTGLPHALLQVLDVVWYVLCCAFPVALVMNGSPEQAMWLQPNAVSYGLGIYGAVCFAFLVWTTVGWIRRTAGDGQPLAIANHTSRINLATSLDRPYGDIPTAILGRIPGNQILDLHVHEKAISIHGLDPRLEGLTIAHLSDLHFTGQLSSQFFDEIVREANRYQPDFVAITGDIVDNVDCLPWIIPTLEPLKAKYGRFFVLGNHDQRLPEPERVRSLLQQAGYCDLGGASAVVYVDDYPIVFGGNERPWFHAECDLRSVRQRRALIAESCLTVALSHSPDQIAWAQSHGAQLMLAGHTHGGQFRLPLLGPILSPSKYGVRFASGTFRLPPTVMHVSRGLSGTRQARFRCPPELAILRLATLPV